MRTCNVIDTETDETILKDAKISTIAKYLEVSARTVCEYAKTGNKIKKRYLVDSCRERLEGSMETRLADEWDEIRQAADLIKSGHGRIKTICVNGKKKKFTVRV